MKRHIKLAKKAFNIIIKEIDDEPMDGDETESLVDELLLLFDNHFANI